jgi:hypothetical protein
LPINEVFYLCGQRIHIALYTSDAHIQLATLLREPAPRLLKAREEYVVVVITIAYQGVEK